MNLRDLFVEKPMKTVEQKTDMKIGGTFRCMECGYDADHAIQKEGKLSWYCESCGFVSTTKAIF